MQEQSEREAHLRALAARLEFTFEKTGDRYTLTRIADVSRPVCAERLAIEQAEKLLEIWKLHRNG